MRTNELIETKMKAVDTGESRDGKRLVALQT